MFHGRQVFKIKFLILFFSVFFSTQSRVYSAGFGFATQWKGGINPDATGALSIPPNSFRNYLAPLSNEMITWGWSGLGSFNGARGIVTDPSGNIIFANDWDPAINKFDSSGVFIGWSSTIGVTPTGGAAGCTSATSGQMSPGWCISGRVSGTISNDANFSSFSGQISMDAAGNFYVPMPAKVLKFNSAGVWQGWIGQVGSVPTGGDAGCTGTSVGSLTPGWCTGGWAAQSYNLGALYRASATAIDPTNSLNVLDTGAGRVYRYSLSGIYQSYFSVPSAYNSIMTIDNLGNYYMSTGAGNTVNIYNSSGVYQSSIGGLNNPTGVSVDSSRNLFVIDFGNYRINKYDSTGTFQGWIGVVATSPTGGASGCAGASVGSFTPGWCTGGTAKQGSQGLFFYSPQNITADNFGNILITDTENVSKFSAATGAYLGSLATVATFPNQWHRTGIGNWATVDGGLFYPYGVVYDPNLNYFYATDSGNGRINRYMNDGTSAGWVGGVRITPTGGAAGCTSLNPGNSTPGWCTGGAADYGNSGTDDGKMSWPYGITVDSASNIYIVDNNNSRIAKYNSAGVWQGWIGKIKVSPTGGAPGCAGAAVGSITPGWCTGGSVDPTYSPSTDGSLNGGPWGVAIDNSGNMYVSDGAYRVSKYNASTGVFLGWIGKIGTSPTGGDPGCAGAAVGSITPGWCKGGSPNSGSNPGEFSWSSPIALDSTGNIYVAENGNNAIYKYNSAGILQGWIGGIGTSPGGGAAGCAGAAVGTMTPGWCLGGAPKFGSGDGFLYGPSGIAFDGNDNFYIGDDYNHRIVKYNSSGVYQGWIGAVKTTPTGGGTGCTSTQPGKFTPNWCKGGASGGGGQDSPIALNDPLGISIDKFGNLYIAGGNDAQIIRINIGGK